MSLFGSNKEDEEVSQEEKEDYGMNITCDNCGEELEFDIPFGTTVKEFLKERICETCGCKICEEEE